MEQSTTGHDAVDDGMLSVHRWRVSQLTRLGIPGTLAEMYALTGDKARAIQNYEKSIALNPRNEMGKQILASLKSSEQASAVGKQARKKVYVCPPCGLDCDKLTFDNDGRITELKVMIRPASALQAVGARMVEEFERLGLARGPQPRA